MFQLDILTDKYEWKTYYKNKNIDLIADKLIELKEVDENRKLRFLIDDRVIEFLTANEQNCDYFIASYIGTNRLEYLNKIHTRDCNLCRSKNEPKYEKVKVKNKIKKVKKR